MQWEEFGLALRHTEVTHKGQTDWNKSQSSEKHLSMCRCLYVYGGVREREKAIETGKERPREEEKRSGWDQIICGI